MKTAMRRRKTNQARIVATLTGCKHAEWADRRQSAVERICLQPALTPPARVTNPGGLAWLSGFNLFSAGKRENTDTVGSLSGFGRRLSPLLRSVGHLAAHVAWPVRHMTTARDASQHAAAGVPEVLDRVPVALIAIGRHDKVAYANPQAAALFGYPPDELVAQSCAKLFPESGAGNAPATTSRASAPADARPAGVARTLVAKRRDGGDIPVTVTTSTLVFDGEPALLMAIVDRSDAYELHRGRQELTHLTRISALGELAGSLAHELNQPLTAILSNAQAAQRFLESDQINLCELRETLQDIVKDDWRAGEIIRKIRTLVRKGDSEMRTLDLGNIVSDVAMLVHSDAIIRGVRIELEIADNLPLVRGDRVQLQQVVLNLLLNSFDAMRDCAAADRVVWVRVSAQPDRSVSIMVSDRGQGLTVDQADKIFKPFFTSKPQGLGLGLSISRSIVAAHGGRIWADNNPERGATFFVTLPVEDQASEHRPVERS